MLARSTNSALALALTLTLASGACVAAEPRFEDFPAAAERVVKPARVKLASAKSREFASELRAAHSREANFAGRFVFLEFGCGASCVMSAAINSKTGDVAWLPFTVCCSDADEPIEFKSASRLLKIRGRRDENAMGTYFYVFDGKSFKQVEAGSSK